MTPVPLRPQIAALFHREHADRAKHLRATIAEQEANAGRECDPEAKAALLAGADYLRGMLAEEERAVGRWAPQS